jgi:hypothetical protein
MFLPYIATKIFVSNNIWFRPTSRWIRCWFWLTKYSAFLRIDNCTYVNVKWNCFHVKGNCFLDKTDTYKTLLFLVNSFICGYIMAVKTLFTYSLNLRNVLKLAISCRVSDMLISIISSCFVIMAYGQMELLFTGLLGVLPLLLPHQILENQEPRSNLIYLTLIKI